MSSSHISKVGTTVEFYLKCGTEVNGKLDELLAQPCTPHGQDKVDMIGVEKGVSPFRHGPLLRQALLMPLQKQKPALLRQVPRSHSSTCSASTKTPVTLPRQILITPAPIQPCCRCAQRQRFCYQSSTTIHRTLYQSPSMLPQTTHTCHDLLCL